MTYRDLPLEYLIPQYNPREAVADHEVWKRLWTTESERVRGRLAGKLDVPYGDTPGQTLDIFHATEPGGPINVFIHGGFWRFLDKFDHTLVADSVVATGGTSVLLNYDLCPSVPLTTVIDQVRRGIAWVYDQAEQIGADRDRLFVSGHSAGAHLAAMTLAHGWTSDYGLPDDAIKGGTVVSSLFDLGPMLDIPGGEDLLLDESLIETVSPLWNLPAAGKPVVFAVGELETDEWLRQTREMVAKCAAAGVDVETIYHELDHHYSIIFSMGNPATKVGAALLRQMGLMN